MTASAADPSTSQFPPRYRSRSETARTPACSANRRMSRAMRGPPASSPRLDAEPHRQPAVLLRADPLDVEVVEDLPVGHPDAPRLLDRHAVRLDFGGTIHVAVAAV